MKNYLLLLLALPLLLACSSDKDEPYLAVCPEAPSFFLGTWEVTEISNVDNVAPLNWDNWKEQYGSILIKFNNDSTCDTYSTSSVNMPSFPYVYSRYRIDDLGRIFCFEPEYPDLVKALLEVKSYDENTMEVVLQDGMYCKLSSYSQPQLNMKLKRQS